MTHCQECAQACRRCSEECRRMSGGSRMSRVSARRSLWLL
ncbi:four-helix bundle copper-binding protein [Noviherbaspirillum saxi]|nr:four-helix bundle copper-binding protein [Noviherbaspirillum saxi]